MLKYVEECLAQYRTHGSESELVKCILREANQAAEKKGDNEYLVQNGTKALVQISRELGPDKFIPLEEIMKRGETGSSPTGGLWPWLKKIGVDILEKRSGPTAYKI